jgi:hypothetical protein
MLTDDELATLLRRGFARATADLDPKPDLVHAVRRRYLTACRRRLAIGVALPAAALAAGSGLALVGRDVPNHTPRHTAVAVPPPSAPGTRASAPRTTPVRSVPMKPASYRVVGLKNRSAPPNCPANATAPVGKSENPSGVWFWTKGTCVFIGVDWADTKPTDAARFQMNGYPGLYAKVEDGVRSIYAPVAPGTNDYHPRGGWVVLTMSANAPRETAVRMILVPGS